MIEAGPATRRKVHVVENDHGFRASLANLLRSIDIDVATFSSPDEFTKAWRDDDRGCLLLDINFPQGNGLDLQARLVEAAATLPVIIMTGAPNLSAAIRGLKAGAVDFLIKPLEHGKLIASIHVAMAREERLWLQRRMSATIVALYSM